MSISILLFGVEWWALEYPTSLVYDYSDCTLSEKGFISSATRNYIVFLDKEVGMAYILHTQQHKRGCEIFVPLGLITVSYL